jgi:hypothetical protein
LTQKSENEKGEGKEEVGTKKGDEEEKEEDEGEVKWLSRKHGNDVDGWRLRRRRKKEKSKDKVKEEGIKHKNDNVKEEK